MTTTKNIDIPDTAVQKYLGSLIGRFYKILPIRESGEPSLGKYMESLQREMLGTGGLISVLGEDRSYLSLLAILQYMSSNDCDVRTVRYEVFRAINICKALQRKYGTPEE